MDALGLDQLKDLERAGWDAITRSRGGDFYGRLMAPEAVMILVSGMVLDRAGVVASLNESPPWASYELSDERLVPIGEDAAALVYRASAARGTEAEPFVALMSSTYRLVDGEPRLVLYQQTTITP